MRVPKVNDFAIGICPECNRRLVGGCEHSQTMEYQEWQAINFAAEQILGRDFEAEAINLANLVDVANSEVESIQFADWDGMSTTEKDEAERVARNFNFDTVEERPL